MAIVYSKIEQGKTITVCDSMPVHTGANGDRSTDASTGVVYTWTGGAWRSTSIPRISTVTSQLAPLTPNFLTYNAYVFTAQNAGLIINAPSGTPTECIGFMFRIDDNGVAQSLSINPAFRAVGVTIPTTTTAGKTLYIGGFYNLFNNTYDVTTVKQVA